MSTGTVIKLLFDVLLVYIGCQAIIHEKELAKFEKKVGKYIKAFFKALHYTIKERRDAKTHM
jgi:hypothetical protein